MTTNLKYIVKYLPKLITEYENKRTWLPLVKAGPSNNSDNSVQLSIEVCKKHSVQYVKYTVYSM